MLAIVDGLGAKNGREKGRVGLRRFRMGRGAKEEVQLSRRGEISLKRRVGAGAGQSHAQGWSYTRLLLLYVGTNPRYLGMQMETRAHPWPGCFRPTCLSVFADELPQRAQ